MVVGGGGGHYFYEHGATVVHLPFLVPAGVGLNDDHASPSGSCRVWRLSPLASPHRHQCARLGTVIAPRYSRSPPSELTSEILFYLVFSFLLPPPIFHRSRKAPWQSVSFCYHDCPPLYGAHHQMGPEVGTQPGHGFTPREWRTLANDAHDHRYK